MLSFDSDHCVVGKIDYQPPPEFKKHNIKRITVETRKEEPVKEELDRRLQRVTVAAKRDIPIERVWREAKEYLLQISEEVVGVKWTGGTKEKRTPYQSEEVKQAVAEENKVLREWLRKCTEESRQNNVILRNVTKTAIEQYKKNVWKKSDDLQEDLEDSRKPLHSLAKSYQKGHKLWKWQMQIDRP